MPLIYEIADDFGSVKVYHYVPSEVAGYAFVAIFSVGTITHIFFMFQLRAKHFFPFIIGALMEVGGYYGRVMAHSEPTGFGPFCLQAILILIAPIFFAATIYMTLARMIRALDAEKLSSIRTTILTKLFVICDVLCFVVQLGGVGMQVTTDRELQKTGVKVSLTGLILQLLVFTWFIIMAMIFHRRLTLYPTPITEEGGLRWKKYFIALYVAGVFTWVRNIVRIVEYAQGFNGFVMKHEFMLYVFDASFMAIVVFLYLVVHPGRLVKQARNYGSGKFMSDSIPMVDRR